MTAPEPVAAPEPYPVQFQAGLTGPLVGRLPDVVMRFSDGTATFELRVRSDQAAMFGQHIARGLEQMAHRALASAPLVTPTKTGLIIPMGNGDRA